MHAGGQRFAPAGLVGHRIEHGQMLRPLLHDRAAELQRVLAGRARDLVHEALEIDRVLVGVDAAPRPDRHVRIALRVLEQGRERIAELRSPCTAVALSCRSSLPLATRPVDEALIDGLTRMCSATDFSGIETRCQSALRDRRRSRHHASSRDQSS